MPTDESRRPGGALSTHERVPMTWKRTDKEQRELESLLDRISAGTIEDIDELPPQDVELLRRYFGNEEPLQDLLDRLRGDGHEAG